MFVKDDTSTCKLMMLDSVRKLIVGCEAEELWDGSYDEVTIYCFFCWFNYDGFIESQKFYFYIIL